MCRETSRDMKVWKLLTDGKRMPATAVIAVLACTSSACWNLRTKALWITIFARPHFQVEAMPCGTRLKDQQQHNAMIAKSSCRGSTPLEELGVRAQGQWVEPAQHNKRGCQPNHHGVRVQILQMTALTIVCPDFWTPSANSCRKI